MSKLVILNLGNGNLQSGFPFVTAWLQSGSKNMQFTGSLPEAPEIIPLYRRWQLLYKLLHQIKTINVDRGHNSSVENDYLAPDEDKYLVYDDDDDDYLAFDDSDISRISSEKFSDICKELQRRIDSWLDCEQFGNIKRQLRKQLSPDDEIRFIIQTEDKYLRRLPWYIWQFFQDYPRAEVSLSSFNFVPRKKIRNAAKKVRILAIVGDSTDIDVEIDRRLLKNLPDAQVTFLVEPTRQEFSERLRDSQGWDLLFFAEHSYSQADGESGQIYINPYQSLTIPQFSDTINKAITQGLQIAIFDSSEGLGLARQLKDLPIPQMIVMREPVTEVVAQEFLKYFLTSFAQGTSFYLAVRKARERLQGIEREFVGASWLPVIFQNPAEIPPTWAELRDKVEPTLMVESTPVAMGERSLPTNFNTQKLKEERNLLITKNILAGRYYILNPLGSGGFSQTFLAKDNLLPGHPFCVVKKLAPQVSSTSKWRTAKRLFKQEAEILQKLGNHPQIPRLLADFEENRQYYLVQEFIEGKTLDRELTPGKQYGEDYTIALLHDILKVLSFVHQERVIHRDIKPANLIRQNKDGKIVLIDFGAVKEITTQTVGNNGLTSLTVAIGSAGYMPSEQQARKPHFSSDVYAVGMIGIKALTGLSPYQIQPDLDTDEISCNCFPNLASVNSDFTKILNKMVRYDYRQRYRTATEALQALEQLITTRPSNYSHSQEPNTTEDLDSEPVNTPPVSTPPVSSPPVSTPPATSPPATSPPVSFPTQSRAETNSSVNSKFIDRCQEQLATHIGPFASFLIKDILADNPHIGPVQLVEKLASQIPNPQAAEEFKQALL